MTNAMPPGWLLRKLRDDAELGERFVLLVMDRTTAALPFETWPGATEELSADEALGSAAALGVSFGAFVDALARARRTFHLANAPGVWSTRAVASSRAAAPDPAGA
jgi:hypothetical protein